MESTKAVLALACCAGFAHAGIASSVILDDFDSDPNDDLGGVGTYSAIILNNPFNQGSDFSLDTLLSTGADTGSLIFNSGIGVEQQGTIIYNDEGAGLDLDAAGLGVQGFEMDFVMIDQDFYAQIDLFTYDDMGNTIGSASRVMQIGAGMDVTADWSLEDFSVADAFDASDIDELRLTFNVRNNPTASLDFIATEFRAVVPPPGSAALLGLGGLLVARRGRD
tara:strand:+ start:9299 stop:9964 length:666 start_codon:yes stop_codon:yes gene_type:complete